MDSDTDTQTRPRRNPPRDAKRQEPHSQSDTDMKTDHSADQPPNISESDPVTVTIPPRIMDSDTDTQTTPRRNPPRDAKRQGTNSPTYTDMQTDYSAGLPPNFCESDPVNYTISPRKMGRKEEKQGDGQEKKNKSDKIKEQTEKIKELEKSLEEADKEKTEKQKEIGRLQGLLEEKNFNAFTWISVLLLVPLCVGLHTAFKGPEMNHHELRLMLVGKTGAGKSASGNTILGEEAFRVEASPASVTATCIKKSKVQDGRNITIIDTPGVMDTWLIPNQTAHHAHECISMSIPNPHMFLLVIRLGRFTVEERDAVKWIQENFGEEALRFTMILFTGGDLLEGKPVEKFISNSYDLQSLVDICERRYHVFNNYERSNRTQVTELFEKINEVLHKNMGYIYSKEVHQKVRKSTREEEERKRLILEKDIKKEEERKRMILEKDIKKEEERKRMILENDIKKEEERKRMILENDIKKEEEKKRMNLENQIKKEEERKRMMFQKEIKMEEERKIIILEKDIKKEEERKRVSMEKLIREEEKLKSDQLIYEVKEMAESECNSRVKKLIQEEESKRKHIEKEMKLEERRKMNEMAIKLRDEQYENQNLKAELEKAYRTSFWFKVVIGILIVVCVIGACHKNT